MLFLKLHAVKNIEQVPDAPVDLQVIPLSSTSLAASWESRPNNLTSPVAGYKLYYYEISDESLEKEIVVGLTNAYTLAGLKKFRQYSIRVAAFNGIGLGMSTEEVSSQTYSDGKFFISGWLGFTNVSFISECFLSE